MTRFPIVLTTALLATGVCCAAGFDNDSMNVSASSLLEQGLLKGDYYEIRDTVVIDGFMNHYKVDSEYGPFEVTGDLALKRLLREIDAIAELKKMTSVNIGTQATVDAVVDTGKSVAALATSPVETAEGVSAGVSRFFKRTTRTAMDVGSDLTDSGDKTDADAEQGSDGEADEAVVNGEDADSSNLGTKAYSQFMGIGKAHRELARKMQVDPYTDNEVLQAELSRVANISGSVGKLTKIMLPIPSVLSSAATVSNMVWSLSPTDLLIQNEETLERMGYEKDQIQAFFARQVFSPTMQTLIVTALASLDSIKGREMLLEMAMSADTLIEARYVVRAILFNQLFHEKVESLVEFITVPDRLVPIAFTSNGDSLVAAPVDQFLWTREVDTTLAQIDQLIGDHGVSGKRLIWVEGRVSDTARAGLVSSGWAEPKLQFEQLNQ